MYRAETAEGIGQPGGTLPAHLRQVSALPASWGARSAPVSAGRCHAFCGPDGFPVALLDLGHREELVEAIGVEAEALDYFHASCDRKSSYRGLTDNRGTFIDRFTCTRM
ncbi:DUF6817 domain-containing protein [Streptomyces sp. NPDC096354]|uniref:DUF6817 domain-containing protein n=1 Tax=Streptomyces sp. NPDC096354 TaxID=3366088 RepID=UPI0037F9CBCD